MRKFVGLLALLFVLSVPAGAQEPSLPPVIGSLYPDGEALEMGIWGDVGASFSDPDGDLWKVELFIYGPNDNMRVNLTYDEHTDQLGAQGISCSPGQNLMTGVMNCLASTREGGPAAITVTWQVWLTWDPGIYEFKAVAVDNAGNVSEAWIGTWQIVAATWPYPF